LSFKNGHPDIRSKKFAVFGNSKFFRPNIRMSILMSVMIGEAVALNAHILLPELVKSVFESVGRRCFDDMLRKSIPVRHHSLAEERSTNATCIS